MSPNKKVLIAQAHELLDKSMTLLKQVGEKHKQVFIDALVKEFDLAAEQLEATWLAPCDIDADKNNPEHWETYYVNDEHMFCFKWFPEILVQNRYGPEITLGRLIVKNDVLPEDVVWYFRNVLT